MIDWKDATKELPTDGAAIWYLSKYYKGGPPPHPYNIGGGFYNRGPKERGAGRVEVDNRPIYEYFPDPNGYDGDILAWCYADQINVPEWLIKE